MLPFRGHVAVSLESTAHLPACLYVPKICIDESPPESHTEWQLWATNTNSKMNALHDPKRTEQKENEKFD